MFADIRRQAQVSGAFSSIAKTRWLLSKLSPSLCKRPITAAPIWQERVVMAQWWADHLDILRKGAEMSQ
ncbi:MAG: hypothetical protein B7Y82_14105 [Sphingomonadales bacterium 32-65-25]|nr:MAG: hypothetical protein B7Y82_14105 [Sphingomonadales bacterium 32-65-25]